MTQREWLVIGSTGQLGREILRQPVSSGTRLQAVSRAEVDLAIPDTIAAALVARRPAVVINAAAWTDVDGAESNQARAALVNADGVAVLAGVCRDVGAHLIHVSTDYVFGGDRPDRRPWQENDRRDPQGVYARTKAAGEDAVRGILPETGTVVRTAWLYSGHGGNFVRTMLGRARAGDAVRVVNDQWGQPTWARDVAAQVLALGERLLDGRAPSRIYHATNAGETTWWELAREIYAQAGADPALVTPMSSEELDRPAPRPAWSVLGHEGWAEAGLAPMRPWRDALSAAFSTIDPVPTA